MTKVLVQNDKDFDLNFAAKDSAGLVLDLTSVTSVTFYMKALNATTAKISGACAIVTPALGLCKYVVQAGDLDTVGNYMAELEVLYSTTPADKVTVQLDDIYVTEEQA